MPWGSGELAFAGAGGARLAGGAADLEFFGAGGDAPAEGADEFARGFEL